MKEQRWLRMEEDLHGLEKTNLKHLGGKLFKKRKIVTKLLKYPGEKFNYLHDQPSI